MLAVGVEKACVWDLKSRELVREIETPLTEAGRQIIKGLDGLSPDGRWIALFDNSTGTRVFDANSGAVVLHAKRTPLTEKWIGERWNSEPQPLLFSEDGRWLLMREELTRYEGIVAKEYLSDVTLYDLNSGKAVFAERREAGHNVVAAAFREDGSVLLVDWDGAKHHARLRRIDPRTGAAWQMKWSIEGTSQGIRFAGGAKFIVCRMKDGLNVYDSTSGALVYHREERLKGCDIRWSVSADGTRWRSLDDRGLAVWDMAGNRFIERYRCAPEYDRETEGYKLFESGPFGYHQDEDWGAFSVQGGLWMQFDENEQALLEPTPTGIRVWEKQYREGSLGFWLLPEVIFVALLSGALAWKTVRLLREAARRERPPWYWRALRATGRTVRRVSVVTWVLAAAMAGSGWMLWRGWGPYEMAHESARNADLRCLSEGAYAVETDVKGHIKIWDVASARLAAEVSIPIELEWGPNRFELYEYFGPYVLIGKKILMDGRNGAIVEDFGKRGATASNSWGFDCLFVEGKEGFELFDLKLLKTVAKFPESKCIDAIVPWRLIMLESHGHYVLYDVEQLRSIEEWPKPKGYEHPRLGQDKSSDIPRREKNGDLNFLCPGSHQGDGSIVLSVEKAKLPDLDSREARRNRYNDEDLAFFDDAGWATIQDDNRCILVQIAGQALGLSPDKRFAYVYSRGHELQQWRVEDGSFVRGFGRYSGEYGRVFFINGGKWMVFSETETRLGNEAAVCVFDVETGARIATLAESGAALTNATRFEGTPNLVVYANRNTEEVTGGMLSFQIWRLARPVGWWGVFWIPWFWVAVLSGVGLVWRLGWWVGNVRKKVRN